MRTIDCADGAPATCLPLYGCDSGRGAARPALCWVASMKYVGNSARVESAPAPASSTEEELAAAKAWQEAPGSQLELVDSDDE